MSIKFGAIWGEVKVTNQLPKENPSFFDWGFHLYDKWIQIKNSRKSLADYFKDNLINCVAIYGLGSIGKRLYEELTEEHIEVAYGIDQNAEKIHVDNLEIKKPDSKLPVVDAVIVTPWSFYEIEKDIYQRMGRNIDIIFIEDIIGYCHRKAIQTC